MKGFLLLLGAIPLVLLVGALTKQREFSKRLAFVELAEKYDVTIGTHNGIGYVSSHCSTAWRVMNEAHDKKKNLSVKDPESDELFYRVKSYLWWDCYIDEGWSPSKI